jgi:hypothetical protein
MAFEDIRQKYLGNSGTAPAQSSVPTQPQAAGGSIDAIRQKYLGSTPSSTGSDFTGDINPINRLMSQDPAGHKKTSIYTPIDYLLNSPLYAYSGALKSSFERAKQIKKKQQSGQDVSAVEKMLGPLWLNPQNWSGALENLKPENRQTTFDVVKEEMPDNKVAQGIGFAADLAMPTIPAAKVAKVAQLDKVANAVKDTKAGQLAAKVTTPVKNALTYRGGQPADYAAKAEAALHESQLGMDKAKQVGELLSVGLTRGEQQRIGQIMKGSVTTHKTEKDLVDRATQARQIIDDLSKQIMENAMKGQEKQVTSKGLAADLVNTLLRNFKAPDPKLGITDQGWRSPDDLARELLGVFEKHQPAHVGDMVDKTEELADGTTRTSKVFQDIGADTRGTVNTVKGGQEIVDNVLSPEGSVPFGGTVHAPDETPPTAFTQTSQGYAPVQGTVGVDKGVAEGLPQRAPTRPILPVETVQKEADTGGLALSDRTIRTIDEHIGSYLPRLYRKYEQNPEGLVKFLNTTKGKIIKDRFMQREDIPGDVRTAMGEILEPAYPAAKAVAQMSDTIAKAKLFRWTNDHFAHATNETGDMVQLGTDKGLGILAGKWLPKAIADDITRMALKPTPTAAEQLYNKALGWWKSGKVLLNPAARARNQITNMMLMNIVGEMPSHEVMNPARWIDAGRELQKKGAFYQLLKQQTDLLDSTFYGNELAPMIDQFEALKEGNAAQRFIQTIGKGYDKVVGSSYQWQEELGKMMITKYWVEQGKTLEEAAKIAEDALFNYNKVPEVIKTLRKSSVWLSLYYLSV